MLLWDVQEYICHINCLLVFQFTLFSKVIPDKLKTRGSTNFLSVIIFTCHQRSDLCEFLVLCDNCIYRYRASLIHILLGKAYKQNYLLASLFLALKFLFCRIFLFNTNGVNPLGGADGRFLLSKCYPVWMFELLHVEGMGRRTPTRMLNIFLTSQEVNQV